MHVQCFYYSIHVFVWFCFQLKFLGKVGVVVSAAAAFAYLFFYMNRKLKEQYVGRKPFFVEPTFFLEKNKCGCFTSTCEV